MNGRINTAALHFVQLFEYSTWPVMASAVALLWVSISEVKTGSSFKQIKNYPSHCWPVYFSKEGLDAYLLYTKKKTNKKTEEKEKAKLQTKTTGQIQSLGILIREF